MNNPDEQKVIRRFFEALDYLKASRTIRGEATFTKLYGINRRNLYLCRKNPERGTFKIEWLTYLVKDFGISAQWLLTGLGGMLRPQPKPLTEVVHPN